MASSVSLDELIYKMKQDKKFIDEKEKEREMKFKVATETYLKAINRENETLKKQTSKINMRNDEFKSQTKNIYYKYFTNSFTILKCEKKLIEERLRFNEYYLRISPHLNKELDEERKNLNNELDRLKENRLPLANPLEVFENDKKRMDFKSVLQQNNHHHQYLENFQKKYDQFRANPEVENIDDFGYDDKIKYGKTSDRNIPKYYQEKIDKNQQKTGISKKFAGDHELNLNSSDYKPKTDVLSQFIYTKTKDYGINKQNDDSLNFPYSKSNKKGKENNENSNLDDDKLVEHFEDDDE